MNILQLHVGCLKFRCKFLSFQNVFHKTGYPSSVWYILGNEFCERFSYYGMHGKAYENDMYSVRVINSVWGINLFSYIQFTYCFETEVERI